LNGGIDGASETNFYKDFLSYTLQVLPIQKLDKAFSSCKEEEDRLQLIDSIDKLIKSDWDRKSKERI